MSLAPPKRVPARVAEPDRETALALVERSRNLCTRLQGCNDGAYRVRLDARHVAERDHPTSRLGRLSNAVRERMAHAMHGVRAERDVTVLALECLRERHVAGTHHGNYAQLGRDQITRCVRGNGDAILQWVHELGAAETRARACREQHGDDGVFSAHAADYAGCSRRVDNGERRGVTSNPFRRRGQ